MKYATFDANGLPTGFYSPDLHGEYPGAGYPAGCIEITDAQWLEFTNNSGLRKWDGTKPVPYTPPTPAPVVPSSCSKLGLKRAFVQLNQWDQVKAAIAASADIQEDWDLATTISRTDPLVKSVQATLNLSDAQVDQILIAAVAAVA